MRPFCTEISRNRVVGGELSEAQRIYILAQAEAGCGAIEIATRLSCSRRAVLNVIHRWETEGSYARHDRTGRPPILTSRDRRQLLRIVKKNPQIEYSALYREASLWDSNAGRPTISRATIQRGLAQMDYHKFRAKRRPFITWIVARKRLLFARRWRDFIWDGQTVVKFSDECSIARGSGHNTTWVWRLPGQKWSHKMIEAVPTGRQPARMVWAAIWIGPGGVVGRSPLVIMERDTTRRRGGYTAWSYLIALTEGLLPNYRAGELFMQDNSPIHTA